MTDAAHIETAAGPGDAEFRDYFELLKPRVMSLVIFTALVGMAAAPGGLHPVEGFAALLCIAVGLMTPCSRIPPRIMSGTPGRSSVSCTGRPQTPSR